MSELISGKDALIALANGEEVELQAIGDMNWYDSTQWTVGELLCFTGKFRLKPRHITINGIELPAPFKPENDDKVWFIDISSPKGYSNDVYNRCCREYWIQFGAWRTEEEIKQVVAALRQVFKS